ncbi:hypothetical protein ACH0BW_05950 [Micrococcus luteus]|uniref:hypothetical protein n=1 Tax=Micrococcus luteus TaxID=1270 RepID=UPI0038799778
MDITLDHAAPTLDYFRLDQDLPVEALALRDRVRTFGAEQVLPVINKAWSGRSSPPSCYRVCGRSGSPAR